MDCRTSTRNFLDEQAEHLGARRTALVEELREVEEELSALQRVRNLLDRVSELPSQPEPELEPEAEPEPEPKSQMEFLPAAPAPNAAQDLSGLPVDFEGARNLKERLRRIGQAAGKRPLNVSAMSRLLLQARQSKSPLPNLRKSVDRVIRADEDCFRKVEPGTFEYCGPGRVSNE